MARTASFPKVDSTVLSSQGVLFDDPRQFDLAEQPFSIDAEHRAYHDTSAKGFFSLLVQHDDRKRQSSYALENMPAVLSLVDPTRDSWLTQAQFTRPNRRVVNLARIGLLFADLDTYREGWAQGRSPDQLSAALLHFCAEEGIPAPSLVVSSGRGLQVKWLLSSVLPRGALPRWNAVQRALVDKLRFMGSDPLARDASRVLRLVNTVNSRSGAICRVVHVEDGGDGYPVRYDFDYLAEFLLPVSRAAIVQARQAKDLRERPDFKVIDGEARKGLKRFSGRQLAWDRLEDLRRLAAMRRGKDGLVDEGSRMMHLFWRMNFLLLSGATNSTLMLKEAAELARQLDPSWRWRQQELGSLYAKARSYEKGETVEFNGVKHTPLYTPRNETLISLFRITDTEQRDLRTIISKSEARRRDAERKARSRAGQHVPRAVTAEKIVFRRAEVLMLRAQGISPDEIALRLKVSRRTVFADMASG